MTRPLASLSSGLLARKGGARPAMRPQAFVPSGAALDDLGWNDMGAQPAPAPIAAEPAPVAVTAPVAAAVDEEAAPIPLVLVERDALAAAIQAPDAVRPVSVATAARLRGETQHAGKAALTLRLDADRHLRLRLAGAISNQSAQILLTQALDALIESMPTVEALVAQLPTVTSRKR
jgi:hypothetical protein